MDHAELISKMTDEEKASLCSGADFWHTKGVARLGIPQMMLTDGPHGLRKQIGKNDHLGLNAAYPATCFPTASAAANSWDEAMIEQMGRRLGAETRAQRVGVILHQLLHQADRQHLLIHDVVVDRANERQRARVLLIAEVRPEQAGRIQQLEVRRDAHPLVAAGHAGTVLDLCVLPSGEAVDERGFSDVRNSHHHRAQLLAPHTLGFPTGKLFGAQFPHGGGKTVQSRAARTVGENTAGVCAAKLCLPDRVLRGVGERAFVQKKQARLVAAQLRDFGICRAVGNPRVAQFQNKIDVSEVFRNQTAGFRHVTGKPLNIFGWHRQYLSGIR